MVAFSLILMAIAAPQEAPFANWREAIPCTAVFDAAAQRAFAANQTEPTPARQRAYERWDGAAMAMFESMGQRLNFQQSQQAEDIRAREE
ncbi:MAG: hypothetical protein ACK4Z5_08985, partial [Brevundimonas sp.]